MALSLIESAAALLVAVAASALRLGERVDGTIPSVGKAHALFESVVEHIAAGDARGLASYMCADDVDPVVSKLAPSHRGVVESATAGVRHMVGEALLVELVARGRVRRVDAHLALMRAGLTQFAAAETIEALVASGRAVRDAVRSASGDVEVLRLP